MNMEWWATYVFAPIFVACCIALLTAFSAWLRNSYQKFQDIADNTNRTNESIVSLGQAMNIVIERIDTHEQRIDGHDVLFARLDGAGKIPHE